MPGSEHAVVEKMLADNSAARGKKEMRFFMVNVLIKLRGNELMHCE